MPMFRLCLIRGGWAIEKCSPPDRWTLIAGPYRFRLAALLRSLILEFRYKNES